MKKNRYLAWLLLAVMLFSLLPTAAFAEETDEHDHTEEVAELSEPAEEPAEEPKEEPKEEPEEEPEPVDEAVAAVAAMIDALPDVETADAATLAAAYDAAQDAADAFYALSEAQQEQVANLAKLIALMEWVSAQVAPLDEHTHSYQNGICTDTDCTDIYQPAVQNDGVYEISNAGKLFWFAAKVNGGDTNIDGKLTDNITVNPGTFGTDGSYTASASESVRAWTPIGNTRNPYTGTFDGNNKTVSGLYYGGTDSDIGLFGVVNGATISKVTVSNSFFAGSEHVGGIVGSVYSGGGCTITNCHNAATVKAGNHAGGVLGCFSATSGNCTITRCSNSGKVTSINPSVNAGNIGAGGVVGYCYGDGATCTISNCYNTGAVSGTKNVGGVVGYYSSQTGCYAISNCYNTGAVSVTGSSSHPVYCGGILGYGFSKYANGSLTNCYNTGTVSKSITGHVTVNLGAVLGGVSGKTCTLTNCYYQTGSATAALGSDIKVEGTVSAMDEKQFQSGEVTYKLNGESSTGDLVWYQTLSTMTLPGFSGKVVLYNSETGRYYNDCAGNHDWKNKDGVCAGCGEKCDHSSVTAGTSGAYTCDTCGVTMAAQVGTTYYTDLKDAFGAVNDGGTVKLLSDIDQSNWSGFLDDGTSQRQINNRKTFTLDLNGKTIFVNVANNTAVSLNAKTNLTIKDSVGAGKIKDTLYVYTANLTVQSGSFARLTVDCVSGYTATLKGGSYDTIAIGENTHYTNIGELLAGGYGYYTTTGTQWLTGGALNVASCANVTVAAIPITGVTLAADKTAYTYGDAVTLTAAPENLLQGESVTYKWYAIEGETARELKNSGDTLSLTKPNVGSNTYRVKATANNYTVSKEITVTVKAKNITAVIAAENKSYDGKTDATVTVSFEGLATGETLTKGTDYTVSAAFNSADVGAGKTVTATVTLLDTDKAKNYTLTNTTATATASITDSEDPAAGTDSDTTPPTVSGIEDGATCYTTQVATVTDRNLVSVTLNGEAQTLADGTATVTLAGNVAKVYTVVATDQAGNTVTYTVTMKPIAALTEAMDDLTEANVTSDDLADIEAAMTAIESALESETATEAEKQALTAAKDNAQKLIDRVTAAAAAVAKDTVRATENITAENVKAKDKAALEASKAALEKALEDFGANYTAEQKAAIEAAIERIDAALKAIELLERAAQMKKAAQTGDEATPVLYLAVIILALAAIATIVAVKKKKQH